MELNQTSGRTEYNRMLYFQRLPSSRRRQRLFEYFGITQRIKPLSTDIPVNKTKEAEDKKKLDINKLAFNNKIEEEIQTRIKKETEKQQENETYLEETVEKVEEIKKSIIPEFDYKYVSSLNPGFYIY